ALRERRLQVLVIPHVRRACLVLGHAGQRGHRPIFATGAAEQVARTDAEPRIPRHLPGDADVEVGPALAWLLEFDQLAGDVAAEAAIAAGQAQRAAVPCVRQAEQRRHINAAEPGTTAPALDPDPRARTDPAAALQRQFLLF